MSYFQKFYEALRYPQAVGDKDGLRRAQQGAAFAVYSHFTLRTDPAIVVMPTGSGKTAILMMAGFLLQANRVLVVTPSVLVRGQTTRQFSSLSLLHKIKVLNSRGRLPKVREIGSRPTVDDWERLRDADVVVATPHSISPHYPGVAAPPADFFDVLLIDEAHHSPASTWDAILKSFPTAKRVLFTATPFRMDRREIIGKVVYNYTLRQAYEDKVFGDIEFRPVLETGENSDAAIAVAAQQVFRQDQSQGFNHVLMVRTGTKKRAKELLEIYGAYTDLKLKVVDSGQTVDRIEQALKDLGGPDLDGIICVDMLGEGFDFPNLKIAALHTPHKSLAVTLQFIGRFARTNAPDLGIAKFIAVPTEIEGETSELFDEGAVWQEVISNLSESRIAEEILNKEVIEEFADPAITTPDTRDVPLYALSPHGHFKVFRMRGAVNLAAPLNLPPHHEIIFEQHAATLSTMVLVTQERHHPKWTHLEVFTGTAYNLIIIYFDQDHELLFINSSDKAELLYEAIVQSLATGSPRPVPLNQMRRVLANLKNLNVFNVGMRSNVLNGNSVSYQTKAGSSAGMGIQPTDGLTYSQGHAFCRGVTEDGEPVTIGYSGSSRFWTSDSFQIPNMIRFCQSMAKYIMDENCSIGSSGLDYLGCGECVTAIPPYVIAVDWHFDTYVSPPMMSHTLPDGQVQTFLITEADLILDRSNSSPRNIRVLLRCRNHSWPMDFSLDSHDYFSPVPGLEWTNCFVRWRNANVPLLQYLNTLPLSFYFADCSRLERDEIFRLGSGQTPVLSPDCIEAKDWRGSNVDITKEFGVTTNGQITIHDYLRDVLNDDRVDVVFRDHTQGEIADFITLGCNEDEVRLTCYHCKGSGGPQPGQRVGDIYEVVGQVLKSIPRVQKPDVLLADLKRRNKTTNRFVKGDMAKMTEIFGRSKQVRTRHTMIIVQPGVSRSDPDEESVRVLAACADYLERVNCESLRVWASA